MPAARPSFTLDTVPLRWGALLLACVSGPAWCEEEGGPSLSLSAGYTGDLRRNAGGGLAVGGDYADSLDLGLVWVTDGLLGGTRMTTNLSVMHLGGGDISARHVGDLQGVNNLEADNGWKLYESWVEIGFGDGGHTLRAGILDLNAEFDAPETQGIFTASPFGIGTEFSQTGARGPVCWPLTGLGVRLTGALNSNWNWRLGAYDGAPGDDSGQDFVSTRISSREGALLAGEVEYRSERVHKFAVGLWSYTAAFELLDPGLSGGPARHGNRGAYAHLDARLGNVGGADLDGSLRLGLAPARFNAVDRYAGAAVTLTGLATSRPEDSIGLGLAWAHLGEPYRALRAFEGQPLRASVETTVELVYRAELLPGLTLSPTLQYVAAPGAEFPDAWVAGLRFEFTREKSWPLAARAELRAHDEYARTAERQDGGSP